MNYFLAESEKKRVRLVSGDKVADGTLREVSVSRHNAIYKAIAEFEEMQLAFDIKQKEYYEAIKNAPQSLEELQPIIDSYKGELERLMAFMAKSYRHTADIMIKFDNGLPDEDFFGSEDFEYVYLLKLRDFFLNVPRNLKD